MLKTCCFKHWGALDPLPLYATTLLSADVDRMENWILLNNNKELTVYYFPFLFHTRRLGGRFGNSWQWDRWREWQ